MKLKLKTVREFLFSRGFGHMRGIQSPYWLKQLSHPNGRKANIVISDNEIAMQEGNLGKLIQLVRQRTRAAEEFLRGNVSGAEAIKAGEQNQNGR